ncbi:CsbD-like protein [Veillonella dispar ATCC 17748]|jgi:uncharacterized protein YjbJ (UPF0337 family)|uniref:CsbD-like protein n=1 Tax=Veillonella dispar ATCC 17748 TaxID=546273 RepID=C4FSI6_9FIRM|nr:CsbD family protein [Veillonella dispar]EEP64814.1 CsbD-like protein [Veillonella dispar ATCC 17748]VEG92907.1 CsbD-like [Veillonella dispar]
MALEDKLDQVKGAVKENAGKLTDDKQMQAEGVVENTVAKVKDAATNVADDVKKAADDVKDVVDGAISGLKNALGNDDK